MEQYPLDFLNSVTENIKSTGEAILETIDYLTDDQNLEPELIKEIKETLNEGQNFINESNKYVESVNMMSACLKYTVFETEEDFRIRFEQIRADSRKQNYRQLIKSFDEKIKKVKHTNSSQLEEVTVTSEITGQKCPITQADLVAPVRNRNCGHIYSRDAILSLIKRGKGNKQTTCPVIGCSEAVVESRLEDISI
ncbi:E3 SUMO-protein ligase NSE2 [Thelohanellus kitauei]|uniref:E3 SUMO-protein ligase NSE2 n=1 Tax=Thelohanellus kitauei TaxID=669202 RepID=A0A0C2J907_THEKT|nr:E3 SUMO-protein ligase NSE2 [Thelohanellus kitauei]